MTELVEAAELEDEKKKEEKARREAVAAEAARKKKLKARVLAAAATAVADAEARQAAAAECEAAALRMRYRPTGAWESLLEKFSAELMSPLLDVEEGSSVGPGSPELGARLGGWLGALLKAGCKLTQQQVEKLAVRVTTRLAEEAAGPALQAAMAFVERLLDALSPSQTSQTSQTLAALAAAFRRHGVAALLERLAAPGAVVRPPATPAPSRLVVGSGPSGSPPGACSLGHLRETAQRLALRLRPPEDPPAEQQPPAAPMDASAEAAAAALALRAGELSEAVAALPEPSALARIAEMLQSGACTPYELALHGVPAKLLPMLSLSSEWPWGSRAASVDASTAEALLPALQWLLGLCEALPVAAAEGQISGLDCLVRPLELALEGSDGQRTLFVEPLLPLRDLERFVLQTTPPDDPKYLEWCHGIVGRRIAERPSVGAPSAVSGGVANEEWRTAKVSGFDTGSRLPVHTVCYESDGEEQMLLLHLREVLVLEDKNSEAKAAEECIVGTASLEVPELAEELPDPSVGRQLEVAEGAIASPADAVQDVAQAATENSNTAVSQEDASPDPPADTAAQGEDGDEEDEVEEEADDEAGEEAEDGEDGEDGEEAEQGETVLEQVHKLLVNMPMVQAGEIPFEMVWGDLLEAGEAVLQASPGGTWASLGWRDRSELETALRTGLEARGQGTVARGLSRDQAELLLDRMDELAEAMSVVVDREDVPQARRPKPPSKPLIIAGPVCRRVQLELERGSTTLGVAVWEHASGALDVVDQQGRFLPTVPASKVAPTARRARHSPGRSMPLELSVLGLSSGSASSSTSGATGGNFEWQYWGDHGWCRYDAAASKLLETARERGEETVTVRSGSHRYIVNLRAGTQMNMTHSDRNVRQVRRHAASSGGGPGAGTFTGGSISSSSSARPPPAPALERNFSALDRGPVHDFQHKVLERKLGEEQLRPKGSPQSPNLSSVPNPSAAGDFPGFPDEGDGGIADAALGAGIASSEADAAAAGVGDRCVLAAQLAKGVRAPRLCALFFRSSTSPAKKAEDAKETSVAGCQGLVVETEFPEPEQTPLSLESTMLQALLLPEPAAPRCVEQRLRYVVTVARESSGLRRGEDIEVPPLSPALLRRTRTGVQAAASAGAQGDSATLLALLRRLRRLLGRSSRSRAPAGAAAVAVSWENSQLNRKLAHQLAQPLLTAGGVAPAWVEAMPLAYPFLFERGLREQLLHCVGFGTSHAVLWLQRQSVEARFGERLRVARERLARTGNDAELWEIHEQAAADESVFVGAGRSEMARLPGRSGGDLLELAERVVELTFRSRAVLEVVFDDETGFGDGVTQSFYTDVASELCAVDRGPASNLWAEHLPDSDGWAGEFVEEAARKTGWAAQYMKAEGSAGEISFAEYAEHCSFLETGSSGMELCEGGAERRLHIHDLEDFVECAAHWWLRDGILPQVEAFRLGVEDVCASNAIWAFEAEELQELLCGGSAPQWTPQELKQHLRPRGGYSAASQPIALLVEELTRMAPDRRGQFLEFVTACPRLPHGGLAAAEIVIVPAHPKGSLPRAHTCTNELQLPAFSSLEDNNNINK
ncbi:unnamed protein product [Polarella glacialis]|uniref:HECT-type E3 ubiquitin transferase n=1 Tax=Polarella glacialis TaxID=89957 RepID=A0A813HZJ8_POLGL|nr:unnamed protein product [Polarella glacialis]